MIDQPFVHLVWIIPLAILASYVGSPRFLGTMGPARLRRILNAALERNRYTIIHDLTLPGGGGTVHFDHIVISRSGIYVIDSVYRAGWISGTKVQAAWRQKSWLHSGTFDNPLHRNAVRVEALAGLLQLPLSRFHSWVVFSGHRGFRNGPPPNVISAEQLVGKIRSDNRPLLAPEEADRVTLDLQKFTLKPPFLDRAGRWKLARAVLLTLLCASVYYTYAEWLRTAFEDLRHQVNASMAPQKFHPDGRPRKETEQWEDSLACAYSVDTGRCACQEPGGEKARISERRCRYLAQKGSVLQR